MHLSLPISLSLSLSLSLTRALTSDMTFGLVDVVLPKLYGWRSNVDVFDVIPALLQRDLDNG